MTELRQDPDRVRARPLALGGLISVVVIAASAAVVVVLALVWRGRVASDPTGAAWEEHVPRDVSHVESAPFDTPTDAERDARAAHARLSSYGWVDRARRTVHVPLDVATQLYLEAPPREGAP